ncbi:hypothetical protein, conserved [Trypanosoma brucei gambiense DAL972]|uniref:Uncharacterized protein n=2 Tax=Trypanosoma brucei TaxID=5691 RepID=C9ZZG1_TRYB9|nr:hypothetical protein, conserved [Trypanosoma brucei gambiense DAL972]RHW70352.1 hypothetical protein DPX39_090085200 [Trypanosoma brucei equiperdum]CBH14810.1 hypothetical protein, conserved [Trypanosoma brucei gambiense DAL972]|eukprot:XP_011777076.1 hypothetical protein, conserved [Trypanosoma brucei gambiense DAL972]
MATGRQIPTFHGRAKRRRDDSLTSECEVMQLSVFPSSCGVVPPGDCVVRSSLGGTEGASRRFNLWCNAVHALADAHEETKKRLTCRQQMFSDVADDSITGGSGVLQQVEVNVTCGDTGRSYLFTFTVPPRRTHYRAMEDMGDHTSHQADVALALTSQVMAKVGLIGDRTWCLVFRGKNVRSEAGAESLMSALCDRPCGMIMLALYRTSGLQ